MSLYPESKEELIKREQAVEKEIEKFSAKAKNLIDNISSEDLIEKGGINPYLVKALGLKSIDEAVEFFLMRRVERSLGTSFGSVMEKFIMHILGGKSGKEMDESCRKRTKVRSWFCWWDVIIDRSIDCSGQKYNGILMAVKSGPADMDKDQVEHFADRAKEAEEMGYRPYLIFVYGKEAWGVITTTLNRQELPPEKYLRIGKDIFTEFFEDPDYYKRALDLFSIGGLEEDLFDMIEKKKETLVEQLNTEYKGDFDEFLQSCLKEKLDAV